MTKQITLTLNQYTCQKCGHVWLQRKPNTPDPKNCANKKCKSPNWNK